MITLGLVDEIDEPVFQAIQHWQVAGEETFKDVQLYSCRRVYYAYSRNNTQQSLALLIALRK